MRRVVIIQEYIPAYRRPFFEELRRELLIRGVILEVLHSSPASRQAQRRDSVDLGWGTLVRAWRLSILGKSLLYQHVPKRTLREADLVVVEQALHNVQFLLGAVGFGGKRRRRAAWGHGSILTRRASRIEQWLLRTLSARYDWFFGYTGLSTLAMNGLIRADRMTVVNNSSIRRSELIGPVVISEECADVLFVGALDASKELPLLLAAFEELHRMGYALGLRVVGDGPLRSWLLEQREDHDWLAVYEPHFQLHEKREIAQGCFAQVLTGRIGLGLLDAFSLGLPLVVTDFELSAPEVAYLEDGKNCTVVASSATEIASALAKLYVSKALCSAMSAQGYADVQSLTVEAMAERFSDGVVAAIGTGALFGAAWPPGD